MHKAHFMSQTNITLPIRVEFINTPVRLLPVRISFTEYLKDPDGAEYRCHSDPSASIADPHDPWDLRKDFLSWRPEHWLGFIDMAGLFGPLRVSKRIFERWQRLLREALIHPTREWETLGAEFEFESRDLLRKPLPIRFDWRGELPTARIVTNKSLEAIIATIQVDKL